MESEQNSTRKSGEVGGSLGRCPLLEIKLHCRKSRVDMSGLSSHWHVGFIRSGARGWTKEFIIPLTYTGYLNQIEMIEIKPRISSAYK